MASSPPPRAAERLPGLVSKGANHGSSSPELDENDVLLGGSGGGHSRLYQRRKEIERELRREFDFAEGDKFLAAAAMGKVPVSFSRPPPVPRPRVGVKGAQHLPPIPKVATEAGGDGPAGHDAAVGKDGLPRKRWGLLDGGLGLPLSPPRAASPPAPAPKKEEPWWRQEQEELERRRQRAAAEQQQHPHVPAPPPLPTGAQSPTPEAGSPVPSRRAQHSRPSSWRREPPQPPLGAGPQGPQAHGPPPLSRPISPHGEAAATQAEAVGGRRGRSSSENNLHNLPQVDLPAKPHVEKARELESLARELKQQRLEAKRKARSVSPQREVHHAQERHVESPTPEQVAEEKLRKQQEWRIGEGARRLAREEESKEARIRDQCDWEHEFRQRMQEEAKKREAMEDAHRQVQEEQRQAQWEEIEKQRRDAQERSKLEAEKERQARARRRAEAEKSRRDMERRAAEAERAAEEEAERLRQKLREEERQAADAARRHRAAQQQQQGSGNTHRFRAPPGPGPPPPPPRGPTFAGPPPGGFSGAGGFPGGPSGPSAGRGGAAPNGPSFGGAAGGGRRSSTGGGAGGGGAGGGGLGAFNATMNPKANLTGEKLIAFRAAEATALNQLRSISVLASKDARQKAFKDLLRAWHPDKNPSNSDVATAIFQRIQAEKSKCVG